MNAYIIKAAVFFVAAFILTRLLIPLLSKFAHRCDILDRPDGVIKKHEHVIPYLGGVAVYCGTLIPCVFGMAHILPMLWFFLGFSLLLFVGLIDDMLVLKPYQKFAGQCIAVLFFLNGGLYFDLPINIPWLSLAFSAFYMLSIINAFNLIDVMDGLATTVALTASFGFLLITLFAGNYSVAFILTIFIGSLLAFLSYNWPPARIYLGDAGSLCIGGLLASLPLSIDFGLYGNTGYLIPFIILAIPLLEVVSLVIIRTYKKVPVYKPSPDHFYMYLRAQGWSKQLILYYVGGITLFLTVVALCIISGFLLIKHIVILAVMFIVFWVLILGNRAIKTVFRQI